MEIQGSVVIQEAHNKSVAEWAICVKKSPVWQVPKVLFWASHIQ